MMLSKSKAINTLIVVLVLAGLSGILVTQALIRRDTDKAAKELKDKVTENSELLAQIRITNDAWRDAFAEYNKKLIVPKVLEPTPTPAPHIRNPIIVPSKPTPTSPPKVITKTVVKRAKAKATPSPKPWYKFFNSTR